MQGRYLVMSVEDIREGLPDSSVRPGWAVGAFLPIDHMRFIRDFEVKEWNVSGIQRNWKSNENSGIEYVSVTNGKLVVILGDEVKKDHVIETERVEVSEGHSILLKPGVWRKYEGTPEVTGLTVRAPDRKDDRAKLDERFKHYVDLYNSIDKILWQFPLTAIGVSALFAGLVAVKSDTTGIPFYYLSAAMFAASVFSFVSARVMWRIWMQHDKVCNHIGTMEARYLESRHMSIKDGYFSTRADEIRTGVLSRVARTPTTFIGLFVSNGLITLAASIHFLCRALRL